MHISPFPHRIAIEDYGDYLRDRRAGMTNEQLRIVSMAYGEKDEGGVFLLETLEAYAAVAVGGSLVVVKPERPVPGSVVGGARGLVRSFSSASRRRLMRMVASMERSNRPLFVTLTYPDKFSVDRARWKRDLDVFGKRFRRQFDRAGFVWRIEFKERKTGQSKGVVAPHFHLLVWGVSVLEFREWADVAWYGVVASGDEKHLRAGVSSERIKSFNGTLRYVSKYIAKLDNVPLDWSGRVWGVVGREKLPWVPVVVIPLSSAVATRAVRLGRKMIGLTGKTLVFGLTWIMNGERMLDYLECVAGFT